MKAIKALFIFGIAITFTSIASAQTFNCKRDGPFTAFYTSKVSGTFETRKHRIETSIKSLSCVWSAYGDVDFKSAVLKYDRSKTKWKNISVSSPGWLGYRTFYGERRSI